LAPPPFASQPPETRMNRRAFLKNATAVSAATLLPAALPERACGAEKRRPNVVLLLADDLGSLDVNCYGSKDLYTPNLDALAARGTRFTQFYVAAPVCSPSRAALLTGRYPQRAGLVTNAGGSKGLPPEQLTLAELLREAGYRTAAFGKWHLGDEPELSPTRQGFDEFFGHHGGCIDNYSHFFYWAGPNRHDLWRDDTEVWEGGKFLPDLIVREATRFLEENKERPFFLYLPFNVPHYPYQGEDEYRERYATLEPPRRHYAEFVSTVDEKIGQVLAKVDELGLRENTLLVFASDNGHSTEERAFWGGGSAGPYRGCKFTLWEGGLRLPCIASLPGVVPEGEVRDQFAASIDWFPTIAELCGVQLPDRTLDGRSLLPILESPGAPPSHQVFHWQLGGQWAVRDGDWKLVVNGGPSFRDEKVPPEDKVFLSNLARDVTERGNLATQQPEVVERLGKLHEEWVRELREFEEVERQ
jgi:arylsulfatase A-like enzyme